MEPVAIISDIHGNLPALQAVIADIEQQGIQERVCLGDIVGYGAQPSECIELLLAKNFHVIIQGNHDAYVAANEDVSNVSDETAEVIRWTRSVLTTNSFNGARALRFDIGFMREHCSNGVIFEEEVATIKASHSKEALAQLKIEITSRSLPQMLDEFSKFLTSVRSISMDTVQSTLALNTVLRLPEAKPDDKKARAEGLKALSLDLSTRLTGYQKELGPNAYAVFNTLTDIAARPPDSAYFQKDRDTIEERSGRWLKELTKQSQSTEFDLNAWISEWEGDSKGRQIPGRN